MSDWIIFIVVNGDGSARFHFTKLDAKINSLYPIPTPLPLVLCLSLILWSSCSISLTGLNSLCLSLSLSLSLITPAGSFFTHTNCFRTYVHARVYTYMYMYFQTSIGVSFVRFDRIIRTNRFAINIDLSLVQLYNLSFSLFLFFSFLFLLCWSRIIVFVKFEVVGH